MSKALVLLSGGQDSATCALVAKKTHSRLEAVSFTYGQRHYTETAYAAKIVKHFGIKHWVIVDLWSYGKQMNSALTQAIPIKKTGKLPNTFVPGRNLVFLSIACSLAITRGIKDVYTGVCQTDYSGYPDCRDAFVKSFVETFNLANDLHKRNKIAVHTPLMFKTKAQTFALARDMGELNFIVDGTLTCYRNVIELHAWGRGCGTCPACKLRIKGWKAFKHDQ